MKTVFIYALKDPDTGQIRYIGKAENLERRFRAHLCEKGKNRRINWIKSLLCGNMHPVLVIIDEVLEIEWQQWEVAYIEYFRECGCDLVNGTPGGEGAGCGEKNPMFGIHRFGESAPRYGKKHPHTEEGRARMSVASRGRDNIRTAAKLREEKKRQAAILAEMWD